MFQEVRDREEEVEGCIASQWSRLQSLRKNPMSTEAEPGRHGEPVSTGASRNRWKDTNNVDYPGLKIKSLFHLLRHT